MSKRNEILREILSDPELSQKYDLDESELRELTTSVKSGTKKVVEVLATVINENDNGRSSRQIYSVIKNLFKI